MCSSIMRYNLLHKVRGGVLNDGIKNCVSPDVIGVVSPLWIVGMRAMIAPKHC